MPENLSAPPRGPVVELGQAYGVVPGEMTLTFQKWLRSVVDRVQVAPSAAVTVALTGQNASIGLSTLVPVAAAGLYRVTFRVRITTVGSVSSSIQVTVTTTEGGLTCTQSSVAYTGNLATAPQSASFLVRPDGSSPLQYSTTYASNGAGEMVYDLDVHVEQL